MARIIFAAFIITAFLSIALAVSDCCLALGNSGLDVRYPGQLSYLDRVGSYFSLNARLTPYCFVLPKSSAEVSLAVKVLVAANQQSSCKFAVRSGGHTTWPGAANIIDGVTIDLSLMNSVIHDTSSQVAEIQPGAKWVDVYKKLESLGYMTTGARGASIGVGGLVIGGGNSYFAGNRGFVCDNVVQFEVVLASGGIIYANNQTNQDPYQALKGGTTNFGIVTRFDITTFPNEGLWGGVALYPGSTIEQHQTALVNFCNNNEQDPYAAMILVSAYLSPVQGFVVLNSYAYTKPIPNPPIFNEFLSIPGDFINTLAITKMSDFTKADPELPIFRTIFLTLTFKTDVRVMQKGNELLRNFVKNIESRTLIPFTAFALHQALPTLFTKHSVEKGGNVMGLDRFDDNLIVYLLYISYESDTLDTLFQTEGERVINGMRTYAESIGAANEFIYLDYADAGQDPLRYYGAENIAKIRAAALKYDPAGVFQNLMPGGFKISKVT